MLVSSCHADDAGMDAASPCRVASIAICTRASRADIDDAGNFAFSVGDRISLFSQDLLVDMNGINAEVANGYALVYDGEYIYDGDKRAKFQAVYPCAAAVDGDYATLAVCHDQSQDDKHKASYMLWSQGDGSADNAAVQLKFGHAMSMVRVRIKDASEVEHVTLHGARPTARLNIRTGDTDAQGEECDIVMHKGIDNEFCAIVPPQALAAGAFTIEAEIEGEIYTYTLAADATLKSGTV
ncbi:MAG: fimbrillin family protein, partial [Roseburia sp.]|nr:fimbrillin family protein [Roseburia sp.]